MNSFIIRLYFLLYTQMIVYLFKRIYYTLLLNLIYFDETRLSDPVLQILLTLW